MLTRTSVVCADRIVATSNSQGPHGRARRSHPDTRSINRLATSRARPFGVLGLAMRCWFVRYGRKSWVRSRQTNHRSSTGGSTLRARSTYSACSMTPHVPTGSSACPINSPPISTSSSPEPPSRSVAAQLGDASDGVVGIAIASCRDDGWTMQVVTALGTVTGRQHERLRPASSRPLPRTVAAESTGGCTRPSAVDDSIADDVGLRPIASCGRCVERCLRTVAPRWRRGRSARVATRRRGWSSTTERLPATTSSTGGPSKRFTSGCASRGSMPTTCASTSATVASPRSAGRNATTTRCTRST